jgi:hypothetical protein
MVTTGGLLLASRNGRRPIGDTDVDRGAPERLLLTVGVHQGDREAPRRPAIAHREAATRRWYCAYFIEAIHSLGYWPLAILACEREPR